MLKKMLSIIVVIVMFTIMGGVFAQEGDRVANPIRRDYHPISQVELVKEGDNLFLILKGELRDGCEYPPHIQLNRVGTTLFVDIYRNLPFDVMCPMVLLTYEEKIAVNDLYETEGNLPDVRVLVINGTIFGIDRFDSDMPALNPLWVRGVLPIDSITVSSTETDDKQIVLSGILTDGCAVPIYRAVPDWQNDGFTVIEAYVGIPLNASCLQINERYEAIMETSPMTSFAVNGVAVPYNPDNDETQDFRVEAMSITSVSAEWEDKALSPNVKITVSGVVDGCEDPISIAPQPTGDNSYVLEVVRVLPADTVCTMIARDFTQTFTFAPVLRGDAPLMFLFGDQMITLP